MKAKIPIFLVVGLILLLSNVVYSQDYAPGDVIVGFNDKVNESEANTLIESYNLTWGDRTIDWNANKWMVVKVSEGEEQYWIDIFQNEEIVKYAQLNFIVEAQDESPIESINDEIPGEEKINQKYPELYYIVPVGIIVLIIVIYFILRRK